MHLLLAIYATLMFFHLAPLYTCHGRSMGGLEEVLPIIVFLVSSESATATGVWHNWTTYCRRCSLFVVPFLPPEDLSVPDEATVEPAVGNSVLYCHQEQQMPQGAGA